MADPADCYAWQRDRRFDGIRLLAKPVLPGTFFDHLFCRAPVRPFAQKPADAAVTPSRTAPGEGPTPRVLVAEDNEINQIFITRTLQRLAVVVDVARNGAEAIDYCTAGVYDLIIMDVQMPVIDGIEATRAIRAREAGGERRTPIIALTAGTTEAERVECLESGMDDFLAKPITAKVLIDRVVSVLKVSPAPGGAPPAASLSDFERALQSLGNDRGLFRDLIDVLTGQWPVYYERVRQLYASPEGDKLARLLHSIKGSVNAFASPQFVEKIGDLYRQARNGATPAMMEVLRLLENEGEYQKQLKRMLGK
jgi:two-component system sensor histidine kinase/response regulator